MSTTIDHLILNSPCDESGEHRSYVQDTGSFTLERARRKAGQVIATAGRESRSGLSPLPACPP